MYRFLLTVTIGGAALILGYQLGSRGKTIRAGFAGMQRKLMKRMIGMMPEDSPPRLVVTIMPRLQEQNDQILNLLKEQSDLLRQVSAKR